MEEFCGRRVEVEPYEHTGSHRGVVDPVRVILSKCDSVVNN